MFLLVFNLFYLTFVAQPTLAATWTIKLTS